ncbi:MAG TPA: YdcF family protein [Mycobacteriales bacterium]|nr:YdcF family protein [Mycobacteriales bacterium]
MLLLLFSKTVRRVLAAIVLVPVLVFLGTAVRVWWVARHDEQPRSDAIVVLGASQFDGRPSKVFQARLDHALDLWEKGVAPRVVTVGGGRPGDRFTEAAAAERYLRARGVTSIVAVGTGSDTLMSLQAVDSEFEQRGWHSAVIVTDPWHSLRSRRMAQDLGIEAFTSPTRTGPAVGTRGSELRYITRESAAYLYYRVFHRSSEAGPHAV